MLTGRHGNDGNAMSRLQRIGANSIPKSVLPTIPEETSGDLRADIEHKTPPCKKPSCMHISNTYLSFIKVWIVIGIEICCIILANKRLGGCPAQYIYVTVYIGIAFLVIILEWGTNWVWRKSASTMGDSINCESPNETAVQLEQQAITLKPPAKKLGEARHIEITTEYPELTQNTFEDFGDRLKPQRPYLANFIFLFIIYFGGLGGFIWGLIWVNAKEADEKCTRDDLNLVLDFIILHMGIIFIRLLLFLRPQGTLCRACVRYRFWKTEECTLPIVVRLNNTGYLPEPRDGPDGKGFSRTRQ